MPGARFELVFRSIVGLTLLSLVASITLAVLAPETEEVRRLIETFSTTWKLGFGAIIALIGGKALGS